MPIETESGGSFWGSPNAKAHKYHPGDAGCQDRGANHRRYQSEPDQGVVPERSGHTAKHTALTTSSIRIDCDGQVPDPAKAEGY